MEFEFRTEVFEGPLNLLLHLIKKNKVDIYDIPISLLTDQFMEYLESFRQRSLDLSSEFLDVASDLFEMKSRMLLPLHEEDVLEFDQENDPRKELIERLLEYKKVVRARECLEELYEQFSERFFRENSIRSDLGHRSEEQEDEVLEYNLISKSLQNVIENIGEIDHLRHKFFEKLKHMQRAQISVEEKTVQIMEMFGNVGKKSLNFEDLLSAPDHTEIIVTFLAILELMKVGRMLAFQNADEIKLQTRDQGNV